MVLCGGGHGIGQPGLFGVIPAHKPLKIGEFVHHFRTEVRLGEPCGGLGLSRIGPHQRGDVAGQIGHAINQFGDRAQFVVEGHIAQRIQPRLPASFGHTQVVFPEEFGIGQTGEKHLLIARQNGRAVVRRGAVGDGHKAHDLAGFVPHGKELLVFFHRRGQNLGRQGQKVVRDGPHKDHRPFDQPRDLRQQPVVFDQFQTRREGLIGRLGPDQIGAFIGAQDHLCAL